MASALTPRSAVLAVGVGLLLAGVIVFTAQKTGILEGPDGPRILLFGTLATFIAGRSDAVFVCQVERLPLLMPTTIESGPSSGLEQAR